MLASYCRNEFYLADDIASDSKFNSYLSRFHISGSKYPNSLVIAAPHHVEADLQLIPGDINTGQIAQLWAEELQAKSVVASGMRRIVDLNKDPLTASNEIDKKLMLFYQNQVFAKIHYTTVEVHGHVGGHYDIEISSGFYLNPNVKQDRHFISRLRCLKQSLVQNIDNDWNFKYLKRPTVGVYPLDEDVYMRATQTYTFKKVKLLRELGVNVYGLHIELHRTLRVIKEEIQRREIYSCLRHLFYKALKGFLQQSMFDTPQTTFDERPHLQKYFLETVDVNWIDRIQDIYFIVQKTTQEYIGRKVALINSHQMYRLGIKDGDAIVLLNDRENIAIIVEARPVTGRGWVTISICQELRNKLRVDVGSKVSIGVVAEGRLPTLIDRGTFFFIADIKEGSESIWLPHAAWNSCVSQKDGAIGEIMNRVRQKQSVRVEPISLSSNEPQSQKGIVITMDVAHNLSLSIGDVVFLSA